MPRADRLPWYVIVAVSGVCLAPPVARPQTIIFVDEHARGAGDGSSWDDAYNSLQDGLKAADDVGGIDIVIRVGQGVYRPDRGTHQTLGARTASFKLISFVELRGGYAGHDAPNPNARDVRIYETVLSGDLEGDDEMVNSSCCVAQGGTGCDDSACETMVCWLHPTCCEDGWTYFCALYARSTCCETCNKCDNAFNVLTASGVNRFAGLDGFTISGGNADDMSSSHIEGGAMYNNSGNPAISNCTFVDNYGYDSAGGIWNFNASPVLTNCTFTENATLGAGGALFNWGNSSAMLVNCTFTKSRADFGGAITNSDSSNPTLFDCTFSGNLAREIGGAVFNMSSAPTFTNCAFTGNSSWGGGGAAMNNQFYSSPTLWNCVFSGNRAEQWPGGGMYNYQSTATLHNCTFSENRAATGGGIYTHSSPTLTGSVADDDPGGAKGTVAHAYRANVSLTDCIFWGNRDDGGTDESAQIDGGVSVFVDYSTIQGWTGGLDGVGNNGDNPLFVDAWGPDGVPGTDDDNLRLLPTSPCIDDGDPEFSPAEGASDPDGGPRLLCSGVDRGAYEFGIGDYNCDRNVDLADFANWVTCMTGPDTGCYPEECEAFDCEYDGDVDLDDYAGFQSALTDQ